MNMLPDRVFFSKVMAKSVDWLTRNCRLLFYAKKTAKQPEEVCRQSKSDVLNCRVKLEKDEKTSDTIFSVEICGLIHAPSSEHNASVQISIADITDSQSEPKPVHANVEQQQLKNLSVFCYNANIGKLSGCITVLPDWMVVAQLHTDRLTLPRKGQRDLQFNIAILSCQNSEELASCRCAFLYDNEAFGYIDLQENAEYTKAKAVTLAFAIGAVSKKINKYEIRTIKNWAQNNICSDAKSKKNLNKALHQAVRFFRKGNTINVFKTCGEMVEIVSLAERYDILELCLNVVRTNGIASVKQLSLLKNMATWLEVDHGRFRSMAEKILPADMHEVEDVEIVLGITADMSRETARQCINNEYRKWNARVTNSDTQIQSQANYMLQFIARARSEYVEQ